MNFAKFFFIFAIVLFAFAGQGEAGWGFLKDIEKGVRHVRDGILKGVDVVNKVADAGHRIENGIKQGVNVVNQVEHAANRIGIIGRH